MYLALTRPEDRDRALRNGGTIVATYARGWLIEVDATRVGAVTYQLHDGSVIRLYEIDDVASDPGGRARAVTTAR